MHAPRKSYLRRQKISNYKGFVNLIMTSLIIENKKLSFLLIKS